AGHYPEIGRVEATYCTALATGSAASFFEARGTAQPQRATATCLERDDSLRFAQYPFAVAGGGQIDAGRLGLFVQCTDFGGNVDFGRTGVGNFDGAREAHGVTADFARITNPVGYDINNGSHRPHAVGDYSGQTDFVGEALIPVDGVAIAGRSGVANECGAVDADGALADFLALSEFIESWSAHASSPRIASVETTVATGLPAVSAISQRVVTIAIAARSTIESTCRMVESSSPATMGRWWVKVSSAWTTREKSMPAA